MNTFDFVGTLRPMKNTETMKGLTITDYDSGWMTQRLRFSVIAGDNRHFVEINAGRWKQDDKNTIYSFSKAEGNNKAKPIQIPWSKRNEPEMINMVAGWKLFTVDLDTYNNRKKAMDSGDAEAIAASNKKCHHFLSGSDFCEYVNKLVNSEKIKDMKFRVRGNINYTYSEKSDKYYVTYEVNKIYRVEDEANESSKMDVELLFGEDAFDDSAYKEYGKAIVNGYTLFYDTNTKKYWCCPMNLVIRDKNKVEGFKEVFSKFEDDEVRKIALSCEKIDGAQRVDIKLTDLDEMVQKNVARGLISEADAIRDAGGKMYGEKIQEIRIEKLARGYSGGSETTTYTMDYLREKPHKEEVSNSVSDDDSDIFDDDEL